ncbi:MAG: TonB-dependent receptor plug domain-containing protein [Steroidobacteraceae bacterium]
MKSTVQSRGRQWAFAVVGTLPLVGTALAQQPNTTTNATDGGLDEIIVTAERRTVSMQKVAVTVSVLNGEDLERTGISDLRSVLQNAPSTVVQPTGDSKNAPAITIRGIGTDGANKQLATAVYEDGIVVDRQSGQFYDLSRVEVLRGPQGTLYGATATAGAVNFISNDPSREAGGSAQIEAGSYSLTHLTGVVNLPVTDQLATRIAFNQLKRDSYINGDQTGEDWINLRAKALYTPTEKLSVLLGLNYYKGDDGGDGSYVSDSRGIPTKQKIKYLGGFGNNHTTKLWTKIDYDLGFATLTYLPAFQFNTQDTISKSDSGSTRYWVPHYNLRTHELRLVSDTKNAFTWIAGAYYQDRDFSRKLNFGGDVLAGKPYLQWNDDEKIKSLGIYGQGTFAFNDTTRLTAGVRRSTDDVWHFNHMEYHYANIGVPIPDVVSNTDYKKDFSQVDYLVRIEKDIRDGSLLYALVSTGYRPGGVGNSGVEYDKETVRSFEIGSKNQLTSAIRLNGDVFYYDYGGFQTPQGLCYDYPTCQQSAGTVVTSIPAKFIGAELELTAALTDRDILTFTPTYLHSEYSDDVVLTIPPIGTNPAASAFVATKGKSPPHAPRWTLAASYEHRFVLGSGASLVAHADGHYETKQYLTFDTSSYNLTPNAVHFVQKPYAIANASLTWSNTDNRYSLTGYVKNVTDVVYKVTSGAQPSVNAPRTFGAILSARF